MCVCVERERGGGRTGREEKGGFQQRLQQRRGTAGSKVLGGAGKDWGGDRKMGQENRAEDLTASQNGRSGAQEEEERGRKDTRTIAKAGRRDSERVIHGEPTACLLRGDLAFPRVCTTGPCRHV